VATGGSDQVLRLWRSDAGQAGDMRVDKTGELSAHTAAAAAAGGQGDRVSKELGFGGGMQPGAAAASVHLGSSGSRKCVGELQLYQSFVGQQGSIAGEGAQWWLFHCSDYWDPG
jgi:hypothetical protein